MDVSFTGRCTRIFKSDRGRSYIDFDDLEKGGQVKLSIDGDVPGLKEGVSIKFKGQARGRIAKGGGMNLEYVDGSFVPCTVTIS